MPDIDEDVMRELMFRSTADLHARPAVTAGALRRQRQRQLRTRLLGVTGVAAAAGLAAGVLVIPSGDRPRAPGATGAGQTVQLTAAQKTLFGLSAAAAGIQRPAGRYVVMSEKSVDTAPGSHGAFSENGPKTSVIDTVTGGGVRTRTSRSRGEGHPAAPVGAARRPRAPRRRPRSSTRCRPARRSCAPSC